MKSQPEVRIRRIAVFTGYAEDELGMAFTRPVRRPVGRIGPVAIRRDAERRPRPSSSSPALAELTVEIPAEAMPAIAFWDVPLRAGRLSCAAA